MSSIDYVPSSSFTSIYVGDGNWRANSFKMTVIVHGLPSFVPILLQFPIKEVERRAAEEVPLLNKNIR